MKGYLVLLALFAMTLATPVEEPVLEKSIEEYVEIVKCFLDQSALVDDVNSAIDILKSGDYSQLLTLAFKAYSDVQAAINKCIPVSLTAPGMGFKPACIECANTLISIPDIKEQDVIEFTQCMKSAGCSLPPQLDYLRYKKILEEIAKAGKVY